MTPFTRVLASAVAATPGAVGGSFAASDGELVDASSTGDSHEWALLTAHYGVILANVEAWLSTKYFGGARYLLIANRGLDVAVHTVAEGYYEMIAVTPPSDTDVVIDNLATAAALLRTEML